MLTFDEIEYEELRYIREQLYLYNFPKDNEVTKEISRFIHTSLFDYDRCKNLTFDGCYLDNMYKNKLSQSVARHATQTHEQYLIVYKILAIFSKGKDDVTYRVYPYKPDNILDHLKKHEKRAVDAITELFIDDLYRVRQSSRIYFRQFWSMIKKEKKVEVKK